MALVNDQRAPTTTPFSTSPRHYAEAQKTHFGSRRAAIFFTTAYGKMASVDAGAFFLLIFAMPTA